MEVVHLASPGSQGFPHSRLVLLNSIVLAPHSALLTGNLNDGSA